MKYRVWGWGIVGLALCIGGAAACKSKKPKAGAVASASASASPVYAANIDAELLAALEDIENGCEVDVKTSRVTGCEKQEKRKLAMSFARPGTSRAAMLPTMAEALASDDPKLVTVAATVLYASFRSSFGQVEAGAVDAATAQRLIDILPKLGRSQAAQSVPAVVHAAMIAGQREALYKMLDEQTNPALPSVAYRHLMTHGGMAAVPKVKALVAASAVAPAVSALESVRSSPAMDEEATELCPWAKTVVEDPRIPVSAKAGAVLVRCGGEYIDALLDNAEKRLDAVRDFGTAHARTLREPCLERRGMRVAKSTDEQCKRNKALLLRALNHKELAPAVKGDVLIALAEQWPTNETKKLVSKYVNDEDARFAKRAKDALRRIERAEERIKKQEAATKAAEESRKKAEAASKSASKSAPAKAAAPPATKPAAPKPAGATPAAPPP